MTVAFDSAGVYRIRNLKTGKFYIGSSVTLGKRKSAHFRSFARGDHHCRPLQRAFAKHGADALAFEVLLLCDRKHVRFYEQRAIDTLKPEYNACPVAGSCLGVKRSAEACAKNGAAHKGRKNTPETRAKMSEAAKGRVFSEEHRARLSAARKRVAERTGPVKRSAETRAKMSAACKARVLSPEALAAIEAGRRKKGKLTPEQVRELRAAYRAGESARSISGRLGMSRDAIAAMLSRRTYAYVE